MRTVRQTRLSLCFRSVQRRVKRNFIEFDYFVPFMKQLVVSLENCFAPQKEALKERNFAA